MFGIAGEWWILYFVIVGSAGYLASNIRGEHSNNVATLRSGEVEIPFGRGESLAEKQEKFMETTQDQLTHIYNAVPDMSIVEEYLVEINDSLTRIEKSLNQKSGA
jgi:hypothetical protein